MGDHEHRGGSIEDAAEDLAEGLRVKRREALIEDDKVCVLEEHPGDVEAAPFTMGELPASLADSCSSPAGMRSRRSPRPSARQRVSACCKSSGCAASGGPVAG